MVQAHPEIIVNFLRIRLSIEVFCIWCFVFGYGTLTRINRPPATSPWGLRPGGLVKLYETVSFRQIIYLSVISACPACPVAPGDVTGVKDVPYFRCFLNGFLSRIKI